MTATPAADSAAYFFILLPEHMDSFRQRFMLRSIWFSLLQLTVQGLKAEEKFLFGLVHSHTPDRGMSSSLYGRGRQR